MSGQPNINYLDGNGIAVTATVNPDLESTDVEIANVLYGLLMAKGDLVATLAEATPGRLPAGTDGQILTADSTQATGLKWAAAGASNPATDTQVWMPLLDTDGAIVLDDDEGQIPTLIAIA
jgi:hypothetical protein